MEVSYVLAAYNEAEIIADCIQEIVHALEEDFDDYELILVNDASTDETGKIFEHMAKKNAKITVLQNMVNLNFGTSVLRGMRVAQKEWIIFNAADLPLYPKETKEVLQFAQSYDVLVLERVNYNAVFWRKITSKANNMLLYVLFPKLMRGTPTPNYIQAFRKNCLDSCLPLARSPIFVWPEMIFRAKLAKLRVGNLRHMPHIKQVRQGAFGKPHDIIWGLYDMFRFRLRLWQRKI